MANEILQPLVAEISWSKHIVILTKCKETRERQFYVLATKKYGWTKDVLIHKIETKNYENYLLGQSNFDTILPIEVATYNLSSELPEAYKELLPPPKEMAGKIALLME